MATLYKTYDKFMQQEISSFPSLIVISSDELLLRQEVIDRIRQTSKQLGYEERSHLVLESTGNWDQIFTHTQNISMFSNLQLVEVNIPSGKPGVKGAAALIKLANQAKDNELNDCLVVIILPSLDKATKATNWAKTLFSVAHEINISSITPAKLPKWINERLALQDQSLSPHGLEWLCEMVEGNLLAANQELQKLSLIFGPGLIDDTELKNAVLEVARYNVFDMFDSLLSGNVQRALKILHGLRDEGADLPSLVGLTRMNLLQLQAVVRATVNRQSISEVVRAQRIFGPKEGWLTRLAQNLNERKMYGLIQHLADIDRIFKGLKVTGRSTDAWTELERLFLRINP